MDKLPYESVLKVKGTVLARPKEMVNDLLPTGAVEILAEEVEVLNKAKETLPFNIRGFQRAKESLRMQHRYLDLRFPDMQRNLRVRSKLLTDLRSFLVSKANFVEIETPTLFKATPGVRIYFCKISQSLQTKNGKRAFNVACIMLIISLKHSLFYIC